MASKQLASKRTRKRNRESKRQFLAQSFRVSPVKNISTRHHYFKCGVMKLKRGIVRDTGLTSVKFADFRKVVNPRFKSSFCLDKVTYRVEQSGYDWFRLGQNLIMLETITPKNKPNFVRELLG